MKYLRYQLHGELIIDAEDNEALKEMLEAMRTYGSGWVADVDIVESSEDWKYDLNGEPVKKKKGST